MEDREARTERATRAKRFLAQERLAAKLTALGWTVVPPPEDQRGLGNLTTPRNRK